MNKKEKNALSLQALTLQVNRNIMDRRTFMKGALALGLTATSALLLYQASEQSPGGGKALAQQQTGELVRRLPDFASMPLNMYSPEAVRQIEGLTFLHIAILLAHPFLAQTHNVYKRECEEAGVEYTVLDSAFDSAKEAEHMDLGISRGYDIISLGVTDPATVADPADRARKANVFMLGWCCDNLRRPTLKYGFRFYDDGYLNAKWMGTRLAPGSKVYMAVGDFVVSAGNMRKQGFIDGAAEWGGEVVAVEQGTAWSQEGGYSLGRTVAQRFPDLQGIFGGEDQGALGIAKAYEDAGRREDVLIAGCDGLKDGQDGVRTGRLDVSVMMKHGQGPEISGSFDQSLAMWRGGAHADGFEMARIFPMVVVTKDAEPGVSVGVDSQWPSPT
jgi:ABC-type sugar transport system substrate-binding protein